MQEIENLIFEPLDNVNLFPSYKPQKTMSNNLNKGPGGFITFFFGLFAILTIKALFDHDNSRIVTRKGSEVLGDDEKMKKIEDQLNDIQESGSSRESHGDIVI